MMGDPKTMNSSISVSSTPTMNTSNIQDESTAGSLSVTDFPEYDASVWIWKVVSPIIIIMGTFGNILSILVLSRRNMRRSSISVYLIILSVTDLVVLYTGLLRQWIRIIADLDVRDNSVIACKIHIFMVYFSLQYSVWILVIVTVERCVSISQPRGIRMCCTQHGRLLIATVAFVVLASLNSHFIYGIGHVVGADNMTVTCDTLTKQYDAFLLDVWPWVDLCMFCLVPFSILVFSNVLIIINIIKVKMAMEKFRPEASLKNVKEPQKEQKTSSVTTMLLALNLVFFISTSPVSIYLIRQSFHLAETPRGQAEEALAWACVNLSQYSNNALNFFMYCFSGRRFRQEMLAMFGFKSKRPVYSMYSSQSKSTLKTTCQYTKDAADLPNTETTEHI